MTWSIRVVLVVCRILSQAAACYWDKVCGGREGGRERGERERERERGGKRDREREGGGGGGGGGGERTSITSLGYPNRGERLNN